MSLQQREAAYNSAKNQWVRANPRSTPEQYEQAMRNLATKYKI
jgi:hypothetical protein